MFMIKEWTLFGEMLKTGLENMYQNNISCDGNFDIPFLIRKHSAFIDHAATCAFGWNL